MIQDKSAIRKEVKQRYREITPHDKHVAEAEAARRLIARLAGIPAGTKVGIFLSMWDEPTTSEVVARLMSEGRLRLLVPRVEGEVMQFYPYDPERTDTLSDYGIIEPSNPVEEAEVPTVLIVPGIAFDRSGGRVGRGKGFYDKYFALHRETITLKIAYTLSFQLYDEVPVDSHDVFMDEVVTDTEHIVV